MTQFSLIFLAISVVIATTIVCALSLRKRRGNPFRRARTIDEMCNKPPGSFRRFIQEDHDKERALLRETLKGMQ